MIMRFYRGWAIRRISDGRYLSCDAYDRPTWVDDSEEAYPHLSRSIASDFAAQYHKSEEVEVVRGGRFSADPEDKHPLPVDFSEPL